MTLDLDEIRARHEVVNNFNGRNVCRHDNDEPPCDAIQLCDEVMNLRGKVEFDAEELKQLCDEVERQRDKSKTNAFVIQLCGEVKTLHEEVERLEGEVMSLKLYPPEEVQARIDSAIELNSAIWGLNNTRLREALEKIKQDAGASWLADIARAALESKDVEERK